MAIWELDGRRPVIGKGSYVFPSADVIGDVVIGKNCFIGAGARIRGDYGRIEIGDDTAIEENVVIHSRPKDRTVIGNNVTVGHGAIVHNSTIKDNAVIGMGAVVSDWAVIGEWAVVAEGGVVKNRDTIPDGKLAVGIPAKVVGDISSNTLEFVALKKEVYVRLATETYPRTLKRSDRGG